MYTGNRMYLARRPFLEHFVMVRLHLAVLTTRNETWRLWKHLSKV